MQAGARWTQGGIGRFDAEHDVQVLGRPKGEPAASDDPPLRLRGLAEAFLALSALPVNAAGIALMVAGIGFLLAEIKVQSHGVLAVGGAIALGLGGLILFDDASVQVARPLVYAVTGFTAVAAALLVAAALRARRGPRVSGVAALVGRRAMVIEGLRPHGRVRLDAEVWNAEAGGTVVDVGAEVIVTGVEGLTLRVRPAAREA